MSRRPVVIKLGSSTLVDANGRLRRSRLDRIADEIGQVAQDTPLCIVSSGAIALGIGALNRAERPTTVADADGGPSVTITAADCCQHCQRTLERSELCLDEDYKWCCRPCWDHSIPIFDGGATPFLPAAL